MKWIGLDFDGEARMEESSAGSHSLSHLGITENHTQRQMDRSFLRTLSLCSDLELLDQAERAIEQARARIELQEILSEVALHPQFETQVSHTSPS